jgi:hypothetical protein
MLRRGVVFAPQSTPLAAQDDNELQVFREGNSLGQKPAT